MGGTGLIFIPVLVRHLLGPPNLSRPMTSRSWSHSYSKQSNWKIEINFALGKNGGHRLSNLGGRSIVVVRQAGRQNTCSLQKFLKLDNFNSKPCLGCLNGFMVPIASYR